MGSTTEPDLIGRTIDGKVTILELLGAGAMGRVYAAKHHRLDKKVAVKVLMVDEPDVRARFSREARAASRLDHPNSVVIHDFGEDPSEHLLYLVMELLLGESLQVALRRTPIVEPRRACR